MIDADASLDTSLDSATDASSMLTPDPSDPKSTPCVGRLGYPDVATIRSETIASNFVIADLDGDGRQDLVQAQLQGFWARRGNGDGTFRPAASILTVTDPSAFALADMNADGRPDLVYGTNSINDNTIRISLNDGMGGFGPPGVVAGGIQFSELHLVDLDGDGRRDVIALGASSGGVAVVTRRASGFNPPQIFDVGTQYTNHMAVADLTGDGRPELVAANSSASTVSVLINDGAANFSPRIAYPVATSPTAIVVGDLDEDGKVDVITGTNGPGSLSTVSVLRNLGAGVLGATQSFPAGTSQGYAPNSMAIADVDGDGHLDVASSFTNSSPAFIFRGAGNGQLLAPLAIDLRGPTFNVAFVDLNNDGRKDLVLGSFGLVSPHLNNGTASLFDLRTYLDFAGTAQVDTVAALDLDDDGKLDLAAVGATSMIPTLTTRKGSGNGSFGPSVTQSPPDVRGTTNAIADFDNDGRQDLVIVDFSGQVLLNHGTGSLVPSPSFALPQRASAVSVGDVDHDGLRDLVISMENLTSTSGSVVYLRGRGDGTFAPPTTLASADQVFGAVLVDLDGDHNLDVVVDNEILSPFSIRRTVLRGHGDGTFDPPIHNSSEFYGYQLYTRDLNADGKADLVAVAGPNVEVSLGTGTLNLGTPSSIDVPTSQRVSFADLDGNGSLDMITGRDGYLAVLTGNGDGTFRTALLYEAGGVSWRFADLDGDGRVDIIVSSPAGASVLRGSCL